MANLFHCSYRESEGVIAPLQVFNAVPSRFLSALWNSRPLYPHVICTKHLFFACLCESSSHILGALQASLKEQWFGKAKPCDVALSPLRISLNVGFILYLGRSRSLQEISKKFRGNLMRCFACCETRRAVVISSWQ